MEVEHQYHINFMSLINPWIYKGDFKVTHDMISNGKLNKYMIPDEILGNFYCSYKNLTTLIGSPIKISGNCYCHNNKLTSLYGCPIFILGEYFACYDNKIDLKIEQAFIKSGKCFNKKKYFHFLLKYMLENNIELEKIKTWPKYFLIYDFLKNLNFFTFKLYK